MYYLVEVSQEAQWCRIHQPMQETQVRSLGQKDPLEKAMGYPLQYFGLGNPIERGAWWATVPWSRKESGTTWRLTNSNKVTNKLSWSYFSLKLTFHSFLSLYRTMSEKSCLPQHCPYVSQKCAVLLKWTQRYETQILSQPPLNPFCRELCI